MAQGMIMRRGGGAGSGLPKFTYTGTYTLLDDGHGNWRIKCKTSGTLTFTDRDQTLDVFMVGGGGGAPYGGGAGGGTTGGTQDPHLPVFPGRSESLRWRQDVPRR